MLIQISSNGLISFGTSYTAFRPQTFPIPQRVVAPYWDDLDLRVKGEVRYTVITAANSTQSHLLTTANEFISSVEDTEFTAEWMLVAYWVDVCPFGDQTCTQVNQSNMNENYYVDVAFILSGQQFSGYAGH